MRYTFQTLAPCQELREEHTYINAQDDTNDASSVVKLL
jgi:hypothetical protein